MSLEGPYRVHLAPQGYEDERIWKPAIDYDAERVVLLVHGDDSEQAQACKARVEEKLDDEGIPFEERDCDLFNPQKSVRQIIGVIEEFSEDEVYVNISTGSKITAISGTIACMVTGATPYYARAEDYGEETVSSDVTESIELPALPFNELDTQYVQILGFVHKENQEGDTVTRKQIIEFAREKNLPSVQGADRKDESNMYDRIDPVLSDLSRRGLIHERWNGNEKAITIRDPGINALQMFQYAADDELTEEALSSSE